MQNARKTLSIRTPAREQAEPGAPTDPADILRIAMSRHLRVTATYNRAAIEIAPHILYTRHEDPFMDGVVLERDGKPPREIKLGSFKLAGLSALKLSPRTFVRSAAFDPAEERYQGTMLSTVAD